MDWIDRYIHEVGRRLPANLREDVQHELASLLAESVEERLETKPQSSREDATLEVLREFGEPEAVARRYKGAPDYLIGPRWFPAFVMTSKIVLLVCGVLFFIPVAVSVGVDPGRTYDFFRPAALLSMAGHFVRAVIVNLAIVAAVFAVLERLPIKGELKAAAWDPKSLPAANDPDRISKPGRVARIYGVFALMVILGMFPQWFGLISVFDGKFVLVDFQTLGFRIPVIALECWWAAVIMMNVMLLRAGRWTRGTRWAEFALGLAGCAILYFVLTASARPELTPQFVMNRWTGIDAHGAQVVAQVLSVLVHGALIGIGIGLVVALITAGVRLQRLVTRYGFRQAVRA